MIEIEFARYLVVLLIESATGNQNLNRHTAKMRNTFRLAKLP